ncbi:GNAT family N-acetyltransferase [Calothrix sp. 336/3]|uniref:GNAT family N-acetyltransferase n=1 Tax=Calothrix sp. 336/3 TaxID=1337936 RepID=UPI0004E4473D|nr:GNAT family N-acetyltransferase [Calothrix sp. 336/3]AKG20656.1 hypothetical protein IJ00_04415 [Calothrix sp. 336/3]
MNIQVISADKLTAEHLFAWSDLQKNNPLLYSPYFSSEYTSMVAKVRSNVSVAIIKNAGEIVGFFPFEKTNWPIAQPIAWEIADYQTLVLKSGFNLDVRELVEACNLKVWNFCNMPKQLLREEQFHKMREEVTYLIDVSAGYDAYVNQQSQESNWVQKTIKKLRKFEREVGKVRFESHVADTSALKLLMKWKSEYYNRINTYDRFQIAWITQIVEQLHATQTKDFGGMLSVLYVGDEIAAMDFGMRSHAAFHSSFCSYNQDFYKYSPGMILLMKTLEYASSQGISYIDLGAGEDNYKQRLSNANTVVNHGYAEIPSVITTVRNLRNQTRGIVNSVKSLVAP